MSSMVSKWLFGEGKKNKYADNMATFYASTSGKPIYEGTLYEQSQFLRWKQAHWQLVWQDDATFGDGGGGGGGGGGGYGASTSPVKTPGRGRQAVLLRCDKVGGTGGRASFTGSTMGKVVQLSTVRTLVPIEKHEVEARYAVTQSKASRAKAAVARQTAKGSGMSAAMAAKASAATKFRFAIERVDGSTMLLAAPTAQERFDWLGALNATLVQQAASGHHSDASVVAEVKRAVQQAEAARERRGEIEEAMSRPVQPGAPSAAAAAGDEDLLGGSGASGSGGEDLLGGGDGDIFGDGLLGSPSPSSSSSSAAAAAAATTPTTPAGFVDVFQQQGQPQQPQQQQLQQQQQQQQFQQQQFQQQQFQQQQFQQQQQQHFQQPQPHQHFQQPQPLQQQSGAGMAAFDPFA